MLTAVLVVCALTLLLVGVTLASLGELANKLDTQADAIRGLQKSLENAPAGGPRLGRQWPSHNELEAARNRIDQTGVAHPGKTN